MFRVVLYMNVNLNYFDLKTMSVLKIANAKSIRFNSLLNTFFYV